MTSCLSSEPGTYWIDWQVQGGSSAWTPVVTEPDPRGGNNVSVVYGNALHMLAGPIWQPNTVAPLAETPFLVRGPGAEVLVAHPGLASAFSTQALMRTPAGQATETHDP